MVVGCSDGQVKIFEIKFGTGIKTLKTHQADIKCMTSSEKAVNFFKLDLCKWSGF